MRREEISKKFTNIHPWGQAAIVLLLLVFLFFLREISNIKIIYQPATMRIATKLLHMLNYSLFIGLFAIATIWLIEVVILLGKTIARKPLRIEKPISTSTKYLMGAFVGAMCLMTKETLSMMLIKIPYLYAANIFGWIVLIAGICILGYSAIRLMIHFNGEDDE